MSKLVPFGRPRRTPDPARLREFAATAKKLKEERATTATLVETLLRETPRAEWGKLVDVEALYCSGAVAQLGREVGARIYRDPQEALELTDVLIAIASRITMPAYPAITVAQIQSHAWSDRAKALYAFARYDDALSALDRAEAAVIDYGSLAHDLALVRFHRAIVLQNLRRFDEAQALLAECRSIFMDHGDVALYAKCALSEGQLLLRRGDHRAARSILLPLLGSGDAEREGLVRNTLGWCAIEAGSGEEALAHLAEAKNRYRELEWEVEVNRIDYGIGTALLRLGHLDESLRILNSARSRFLRRGLVEEAGLCGLGMAEVHLLHGQSDRARDLAVRLVQEFTNANLNRRAVAALAYLNEALASAVETPPQVVRSVSTYISALRHDPQREFTVVN